MKASLSHRELADILKEKERYREALEQIASCERHAPGDVVDIARQALGFDSAPAAFDDAGHPDAPALSKEESRDG